MKLIIRCVIAAAFIFSTQSHARYVGTEPIQFTPAQNNWMKTLRSPTKSLCCDENDGDFTSQAIKPGADGKLHWFATIKGEWYEVPDDAIVTDTPNIVGRPLVWYLQWIGVEGKLVTRVRCFLPGALG